MKKNKKDDEIILKLNKVREIVKSRNKQISSEFFEDFNEFVRELLIFTIINSNPKKKRLNAEDVKHLKKLIRKCEELMNDKQH